MLYMQDVSFIWTQLREFALPQNHLSIKLEIDLTETLKYGLIILTSYVPKLIRCLGCFTGDSTHTVIWSLYSVSLRDSLFAHVWSTLAQFGILIPH